MVHYLLHSVAVSLAFGIVFVVVHVVMAEAEVKVRGGSRVQVEEASLASDEACL